MVKKQEAGGERHRKGHNKVIIGETEWMLEEEEGRMKVFIPRKRREDGGTGEKRNERPRTSSSGMSQE